MDTAFERDEVHFRGAEGGGRRCTPPTRLAGSCAALRAPPKQPKFKEQCTKRRACFSPRPKLRVRKTLGAGIAAVAPSKANPIPSRQVPKMLEVAVGQKVAKSALDQSSVEFPNESGKKCAKNHKLGLMDRSSGSGTCQRCSAQEGGRTRTGRKEKRICATNCTVSPASRYKIAPHAKEELNIRAEPNLATPSRFNGSAIVLSGKKRSTSLVFKS